METKRRLVRVLLDQETSWGEHVEGNIYRSLNDCFTNIEVRYPLEHRFASHNGEKKRLVWGDLFQGVEAYEMLPGGKTTKPSGRVRPTFIFGEDLTVKDED